MTLPPFLNAKALLASAGDSACALLRREPEVFVCLVMEARKFSARYYGGPVYLVGSAVTSDDPRDIDLVAIVPKALFYASYGAASAEEGVDLFLGELDLRFVVLGERGGDGEGTPAFGVETPGLP